MVVYVDSTFTIKDLGQLHYSLGIEINYSPQGMILTQQKYTQDLLVASEVTRFKKVVTPLPLNLKLNPTDGEILADGELYRSLVGKLKFLTNTRPNISFTVQTLSQFMQSPRTPH